MEAKRQSAQNRLVMAGFCVIDTPDGQVTISFKPKERRIVFNWDPLLPSSLFGLSVMAICHGGRPIDFWTICLWRLLLSIRRIFSSIIMTACRADEMIFKRTPSQIGRTVELCHPPKFLTRCGGFSRLCVRESG